MSLRLTLPIVATLLIIGGGCSSGVDPSERIPDSLLTAVLTNVYAATSQAQLDGTDPGAARQKALEAFGLDTIALRNTLDYFAENPDSGAVAYQAALDSLISIQRELHRPAEIDSLRSTSTD